MLRRRTYMEMQAVRILYRQPADSRAAPDRALIHGMRKASVMGANNEQSQSHNPTH